MPIAKLIIDQRDVAVVQAAIRRITIEQRTVGSGRSEIAQAKRLDKVKFKNEPVVVADTLQQMTKPKPGTALPNSMAMVYLPVLYVDGVLTAIDGVKALNHRKKAQWEAEKHARICRQHLKDRW